MKIEGYVGICPCCFGPIEDGTETRLRPNGRIFHAKCAERNPDNYYVRLELQLADAADKKGVQG